MNIQDIDLSRVQNKVIGTSIESFSMTKSIFLVSTGSSYMKNISLTCMNNENQLFTYNIIQLDAY